MKKAKWLIATAAVLAMVVAAGCGGDKKAADNKGGSEYPPIDCGKSADALFVFSQSIAENPLMHR